MRSSLAFLALFYSASLWSAPCQRAVDQKKVMVFVNMNSAFLEQDAAEKAACQRGEKFVIIPTMTAEAKAYRDAYMPYAFLLDRHQAMSKSKKKPTKEQTEELRKAQAEMQKRKKMVPDIDNLSLKIAFKEMAKEDVNLQSVIISGHNGGNMLGGDMGMIYKADVRDAVDSAFKGQKRKQLDQFRSILYWGCYTATPDEIMSLKATFPQLKLVAGFNDGGPLSIRSASYDLLEDLLKKEHALYSTKNQAEMKKLILSLKEVTTSWPGIYAENCNDESYYYQRGRSGNKFDRFSTFQGCDDVKEKIKALNAKFQLYLDGDKALPTDTANGMLRTYYSWARQYQHCIDPDSTLNPDRIGALLFVYGFTKNFEQTFAESIGKAQLELKNVKFQVEKLLDSEIGIVDQIKEKWGENLAIRIEAEEFIKTFEKHKISLEQPFKKPGVSRMNRKQLLASIHNIEKLTTLPLYKNHKQIQDAFDDLVLMKERMVRYLQHADPKCMDFLDWHDFRRGIKAKPKC